MGPKTMSPDSQAFLHLTSGSAAANVIRETVSRLERDEVVIGMRYPLAEGPLQDADEGASSRVEWWSRLHGKPLDADAARECDDVDIWTQVRAAPDDVMLWHGPHPEERIFALRACWHLRDQPERVHEVMLPPSATRWTTGVRPAFYDAIPIVGPDVTVQAWDRRAKVVDVTARARQWEELRGRPGEWVRVLDGESVVHRPITAYDAELLQALRNDEWTRSLKIVGTVLAANAVTGSLLYWRVRELLRAGTLEGRGDENQIGLPDEVRRVTGASPQ